MVERVKTGIIRLDEMLEGGLIKDKVYLIAGEPGSGKTLFCLQFLHTGLKNGENGIYITAEEKPQDIVDDAKSLGWDLEKYIKEKKLIILDITPYLVRVKDGEEVDVFRMVNDLLKYVHENNAKRMVIDPITPVVYQTRSEKEIRESIRELVTSLEDNIGCTTLITSPVPIGSKRISESDIEEFIVSGIIIMGIEERENRIIRTLFVRKMRETAFKLAKYEFEVIKGVGIVIKGEVKSG